MISPRRSFGLWFFLALWAVAALCRAAYLAGPARERKMAKASRIAGREGVIPAIRGTIFDRDRVPVAWDEARLELRADPDFSAENAEELSAVLKRSASPDFSGVIVHRLRPDEVEKTEPLWRAGLPARIVFRRDRVFAVSGTGRERVENLEIFHDAVLRGRDGRFQVMLDRRRDEIPGSWRLVEEPVRGQDVVLDVSLTELEGK
ncbi:MAG: hypothetical protein MJ016_07835 [Victivallaceae bacterium]|nr:hypothetical protein [Victivallaceae bacterium]